MNQNENFFLFKKLKSIVLTFKTNLEIRRRKFYQANRETNTLNANTNKNIFGWVVCRQFNEKKNLLFII